MRQTESDLSLGAVMLVPWLQATLERNLPQVGLGDVQACAVLLMFEPLASSAHCLLLTLS